MNAIAEYILAFESILYGLIVSRILIKWNMMLQERDSIKHYWAHYLLTFSVFLFIIYVYIANFDRDHYTGLTRPLPFLIFGVLPPALFTFLSFQMFPNKLKATDLKQFVMENRWKIFLPGIAFGLYFTLYMSRDELAPASYIAFTLLMLASLAIALKKYWLIEAMIISFFLFMMYVYIIPFL